MDVYPIEHRGKIYHIITALDMTFREVRGMLDRLDERKAFQATEEDEFLGPGKLLSVEFEGTVLEVDVHGYEVVVYRRSASG